jgi:hypothetical protein
MATLLYVRGVFITIVVVLTLSVAIALALFRGRMLESPSMFAGATFVVAAGPAGGWIGAAKSGSLSTRSGVCFPSQRLLSDRCFSRFARPRRGTSTSPSLPQHGFWPAFTMVSRSGFEPPSNQAMEQRRTAVR